MSQAYLRLPFSRLRPRVSLAVASHRTPLVRMLSGRVLDFRETPEDQKVLAFIHEVATSHGLCLETQSEGLREPFDPVPVTVLCLRGKVAMCIAARDMAEIVMLLRSGARDSVATTVVLPNVFWKCPSVNNYALPLADPLVMGNGVESLHTILRSQVNVQSIFDTASWREHPEPRPGFILDNRHVTLVALALVVWKTGDIKGDLPLQALWSWFREFLVTGKHKRGMHQQPLIQSLEGGRDAVATISEVARCFPQLYSDICHGQSTEPVSKKRKTDLKPLEDFIKDITKVLSWPPMSFLSWDGLPWKNPQFGGRVLVTAASVRPIGRRDALAQLEVVYPPAELDRLDRVFKGSSEAFLVLGCVEAQDLLFTFQSFTGMAMSSGAFLAWTLPGAVLVACRPETMATLQFHSTVEVLRRREPPIDRSVTAVVITPSVPPSPRVTDDLLAQLFSVLDGFDMVGKRVETLGRLWNKAIRSGSFLQEALDFAARYIYCHQRVPNSKKSLVLIPTRVLHLCLFPYSDGRERSRLCDAAINCKNLDALTADQQKALDALAGKHSDLLIRVPKFRPGVYPAPRMIQAFRSTMIPEPSHMAVAEPLAHCLRVALGSYFSTTMPIATNQSLRAFYPLLLAQCGHSIVSARFMYLAQYRQVQTTEWSPREENPVAEHWASYSPTSPDLDQVAAEPCAMPLPAPQSPVYEENGAHEPLSYAPTASSAHNIPYNVVPHDEYRPTSPGMAPKRYPNGNDIFSDHHTLGPA